MRAEQLKEKKLLSRECLWPADLGDKLFVGFSDEDLELLCDWGLRGYDAKLSYRSARWIYWTVELYSFGRCYRDWLSLPSWLPLPLYGDHGVAPSGELSQHERQSKPKIHLTWFKERAQSIAKNSKKKILRIPHPWVTWRRKYRIEKKPTAKGTLVFFSHSNAGTEIVNYDYAKYFNRLKALPKSFHPLVLCMHKHDIIKGYHKVMRKYGLPIISAGETSSPFFAERFYMMISNFEYGTSPLGGSELYYCEELGVRYFIYGEEPNYVNFSNPGSPLGPMQPDDDVTRQSASDKKRALFSSFPPKNCDEKERFVSDVLGLDIDAEDAKKELKKLLLVEYARHIPEVMVRLTQSVVHWILPSRVKALLRSVRSNFPRILR